MVSRRVRELVRITRAPFLTAAIAPVLLGTAIAWREGAFHFGYFLLTLVGAVAIHAGLNMSNDYFDHLSGNDELNRELTPFSGGSRVIQEGMLSARQVLIRSLSFYGIGIAIGVYLAAVRGWPLLWIGLAGLFLTAITALLLTIDLERPERCFFVLIHPQWSSWLTRGAYLLLGFGVVAGIWWISEVAAWVDWIDGAPRLWLAAFTLPCAAGASIYTAFLFAQAEGRDLWQSPLLPGHLVLRSAMMGSGLLLLIEALMGAQTEVARGIYLFSSVASLFALLVGDLAVPHTSEVGARAADEIRRGRYRWYYWCGGAVAGHLIPMTLVLLGDPDLSYLAVGLAAGGLYAFEYAFVMAPQEIPNS